MRDQGRHGLACYAASSMTFQIKGYARLDAFEMETGPERDRDDVHLLVAK